MEKAKEVKIDITNTLAKILSDNSDLLNELAER